MTLLVDNARVNWLIDWLNEWLVRGICSWHSLHTTHVQTARGKCRVQMSRVDQHRKLAEQMTRANNQNKWPEQRGRANDSAKGRANEQWKGGAIIRSQYTEQNVPSKCSEQMTVLSSILRIRICFLHRLICSLCLLCSSALIHIKDSLITSYNLNYKRCDSNAHSLETKRADEATRRADEPSNQY